MGRKIKHGSRSGKRGPITLGLMIFGPLNGEFLEWEMKEDCLMIARFTMTLSQKEPLSKLYSMAFSSEHYPFYLKLRFLL